MASTTAESKESEEMGRPHFCSQGESMISGRLLNPRLQIGKLSKKKFSTEFGVFLTRQLQTETLWPGSSPFTWKCREDPFLEGSYKTWVTRIKNRRDRVSHREATSHTLRPGTMYNEDTGQVLRENRSTQAGGMVDTAIISTPLEGGIAQLQKCYATSAINWDISP